MSDVGRWQGIYPAAMTMFDKKGNLDENATVNHFDWLIKQGVQGLVVAGTSGEFIALTDLERRRVIELGISTAKGRVPVFAGTGYYSTRNTIELTQFAEDKGADGALVILPYYQKPKKPGLIEHYRQLHQNTGLPLFCYNNPAYSGAPELTPWELIDLYREGVLAGVKSTFATVHQIHNVSFLAGADDFAIFYGSFMSALEGFAGGATGWISGILNIVPSLAVSLWKAIFKEKNLEKGQEIWFRILPLVNIYTQQQLGPVDDLSLYRAALELMGRHGGYSRSPFMPLTKEQVKSLEPYLVDAGLL